MAAHQPSHEPIGSATLGLSLNDEDVAARRELIAGPWVGHLARPDIEGRGPGMDARIAEAGALPLISTRGRVQIGNGFDCTCSITQRASCWSAACLA
jgi:hypothetical protein